MHNKYLYSFHKDVSLRSLCILSFFGIIFCLILVRLSIGQSLAFKDIDEKQALIAQIPDMQAKIGQPKVFVKGLSLVLNGIVSGKGQPMAVINDTFVKLGGKIDGKEVTAITEKTATLCDVVADNKCIKLYIE